MFFTDSKEAIYHRIVQKKTSFRIWLSDIFMTFADFISESQLYLSKGQVISVRFLPRVGILSFSARMAKSLFGLLVPWSRFQLDASRIQAYSITQEHT
jgi:hypothetical protein